VQKQTFSQHARLNTPRFLNPRFEKNELKVSCGNESSDKQRDRAKV
jgi:hypothetical protein